MGVRGDAGLVLGEQIMQFIFQLESLLTAAQIFVTLRDERRKMMAKKEERRKAEDDRL